MKRKGRMINQSISRSQKISDLNPKSLSLFCLLLPHLNAHGKMNGNIFFIKGEVCPLIKWLDTKTIEKCLIEISKKTNIKWYKIDDLQYIQSLSFPKHQKLRNDRSGDDELPDYSRTTPGLLQNSLQEVKLSKEEEEEVKVDFDFEKVWKNYPNKDGKKEAEKHFNTSIKNEKDYSDIKKALKNYKTHLKINTWKHPKNGSTWFNNWRDWINFVEPPQPKEKSSRVDIDETDWSKEKPGIVEDF